MADADLAAAGKFKIGGELTVRRLGFGTMRLTGSGIWGEPADRPEALRTLKRARELGIDFIDTADSYGPDVAEKLIREALHPYGNIRIATKALRRSPVMLPIPGTSKVAHLEENVAAARITLSESEIAALEGLRKKI
jgi:aryl-alcohol dehydrogenase-like predicted oxidoreductase